MCFQVCAEDGDVGSRNQQILGQNHTAKVPGRITGNAYYYSYTELF